MSDQGKGYHTTRLLRNKRQDCMEWLRLHPGGMSSSSRDSHFMDVPDGHPTFVFLSNTAICIPIHSFVAEAMC